MFNNQSMPIHTNSNAIYLRALSLNVFYSAIVVLFFVMTYGIGVQSMITIFLVAYAILFLREFWKVQILKKVARSFKYDFQEDHMEFSRKYREDVKQVIPYNKIKSVRVDKYRFDNNLAIVSLFYDDGRSAKQVLFKDDVRKTLKMDNFYFYKSPSMAIGYSVGKASIPYVDAVKAGQLKEFLDAKASEGRGE